MDMYWDMYWDIYPDMYVDKVAPTARRRDL